MRSLLPNWELVRTSKNVLYENPYCVRGAVKPTGSEQTPTGKCTDRIIGTRKGTESASSNRKRFCNGVGGMGFSRLRNL